jgi:hypothetical protein
MLDAVRLGRDLRARKRSYPEAWNLGSRLAEDRFQTMPGEDRDWNISDLGEYMRTAGADAVRLMEGAARRQGRTLPPEFLSTLGIACGLHLEGPLKRFFGSGAASENRQLLNDFRDDYARGLGMAETIFFPEAQDWLDIAPFIGDGLDLRMDMGGLGMAFANNAFSPPFRQPVVGQAAYRARTAQLITHYILDDQDELAARSETALAERA